MAVARCMAVTGAPEPGRQLSVTDLISLLTRASRAWDKYDKDRNGSLSLKECEEIFNSAEITQAFESLTNMSHRAYTSRDLEPYFKHADKDSSGTLSRTEFLALYLAIMGDRVKRNPLLLAEALLGFIDKDKNGVLEGKELKGLLLILGFAPALLLPIPDFVRLEHRPILKRLGRVLEGSGDRGSDGKAKKG
ncbi:calmodulin-like protein camb [Volvox carteri f. nagariensis]|uniref:Calmodulin-like protein camb n=1 Tax=Volvox carteri f. nagariensis TaxID=3068 RepID=D8TH98_VOLCA|nr:calmodulin-like protein camb [Volvox carteri f. nagariensis]EFJ53034.1 calmodulin-like protein camb [Volvox carteri f. nagariensis]|eukprot:XP_002946039.1 calmodulin-like protein camb [Volvox carteri f. nagariensis]